jgi:RecA/RadA recombinase
MSGSIFGGMPNRRSVGLCGATGCAKSFLALAICRNAQMKGYNIIYCDSEAAMDIEFVKKLGIDTRRFRIQPVSTIQETAHFYANLVKQIKELKEAGKQVPKIMVVLDSLGNLSSDKEKTDIIEGNDKRDMTKQQAIRGMFRVVGNDFGILGIPFVITAHIYDSLSMYTPQEISGGGGLKYNASIIFMMSKSKLDDKEGEERAKKDGVETTRVGVTITISPYKQRFARPIKVQIHIPFYKPLNPFVGLEKFVS